MQLRRTQNGPRTAACAPGSARQRGKGPHVLELREPVTELSDGAQTEREGPVTGWRVPGERATRAELLHNVL